MIGLESAALAKLSQEGMKKILEQNMLSPSQIAAREGKIPNISDLNKDKMDVQESLAKKLTDSGKNNAFSPEAKLKNEFAEGYQREIRDVVAEGRVPEIEIEKLRPSFPEEIAEKRLDFCRNKRDLIQQWEVDNRCEWPRYNSDVHDEVTGVKIRRTGDLYDAHHLQPLELGGENKSTNLVPVHAKDHYDHRGIHRSDSYLSKLRDLVKGA